MAKKKGSNTKKKKKNSYSKLLSGPNSIAMKSKPPKENPFETIWTRKKFNILGKKRKGEEKRTGLARSRAIDKRKDTLLKEYEQSGKSSVFVDKRIGEHNEALGEFDKAILRSQRERQVKVKKSKFNLSDGEEEDDDGIYNNGPFLERDDYREELSPDEDADEMAEPTLLKHVDGHNKYDPSDTGLVEGLENKHKSKKEVMNEIILKSKFFKAQKSKEKEENEELMDQLDKNFTSLVQSEALLSLTKKDEDTAPHNDSSKPDQPDNYDKLVKAMAQDMRARPSERTKTDEEIAQEERETLDRLEAERKKRKLGNGESSDEDANDNEDGSIPSAKKLRSISGDDLGDSFSFDEEPGRKMGWVDEILQRDASNTNAGTEESSEDSETEEEESDQEDSSKDNDEHGKSISLKDWEQSDDDTLGTDLDDDEEEGDDDDDGDDKEEEEEEEEDMQMKGRDLQNTKVIVPPKDKTSKADTSSFGKTRTNGKLAPGQDDTLPHTIEAPNSLTELCSLVDGRPNSDVVEAIRRIRGYNSIKLAAENRKKMQVFYGILLQYFAVVANKRPLNFKLLNLLVKPLMEMSMETPFFAAICARERLHHTRAKFCEDIKNPEKSCWPSMKTLFLLRLWSMIFPCSDFRHVVMTPASLLMSEYLMRCPITSGRDIAIGSFLCSMVLSVTRQSQKFCPEAVIFLRTLLMSALERDSRLLQQSQIYYLSELKMLKPWLMLHGNVNEIESVDFMTVMNMPESSPFFSSDGFRASILMSVIETLRGYVNTYEEYNSFPEIFLPISTLLSEMGRQDNIPAVLQDSIKDVSELIQNKAEENHMLRRPLQMRKQKPVAIKLLTPKYEENFVKGRDYDPDRERAEVKKLKKQLKREAKGAARELRKDNSFLFDAKDKDRRLLNEERAEQRGKAKAFLQEQEHAFKSGQLGKRGKGRR